MEFCTILKNGGTGLLRIGEIGKEMRNLGIKKMNHVKPTAMQLSTFENIKRGMKLRDAMIAGGFKPKTSDSPKQNLLDSRGFTELIKEYREDLRKAGVTKEVLAEIQAEGLFDADASVRLDYLRENKKDLGLIEPKDINLTQINIGGDMGIRVTEYDPSTIAQEAK